MRTAARVRDSGQKRGRGGSNGCGHAPRPRRSQEIRFLEAFWNVMQPSSRKLSRSSNRKLKILRLAQRSDHGSSGHHTGSRRSDRVKWNENHDNAIAMLSSSQTNPGLRVAFKCLNV